MWVGVRVGMEVVMEVRGNETISVVMRTSTSIPTLMRRAALGRLRGCAAQLASARLRNRGCGGGAHKLHTSHVNGGWLLSNRSPLRATR